MQKPKKKRVLSIIGNILFVLALLAMLGGALLFALSANTDKSIFGYRFYQAMSDSMNPEIERGGMLVVKMAGVDEVKAGDIVTCAANESGDVTVTHRLMDIYHNQAGQTMLVTKGDANQEEDEPILGERLIGRVAFYLPFVGTAVGFVRENFPILLINLAVLIAAILGIRHLLKGRKNTGAHTISPTKKTVWRKDNERLKTQK